MRKVLLAALVIALMPLSAFSAAEKKRVWIAYKEGGRSVAEAALKNSAAEIHYDMRQRNAVVATLPSKAIENLSRKSKIEFIEDDVKRYPMAEVSPYGIAMVQANLVDDNLAGNRTVCIIDSGYDLSHEDLPTTTVSGTDDPGTGSWATDESGHGTHVAGTIAAVANNNKGVVGVMPNGTVGLHIIKVFGASGWAYSSSLVAALDACEASGANVVSMSLGGSFKSRSEDRAFAAADGRGVLSIAAAGNDGNTRKSYPASYSSVVSVAAIDSNKALADFSQRNDQVELSGPGVAVKSTVPMGTGSDVQTSVAGASYEALAMDGSAQGSASGALVDCGTAEGVCAASQSVCLIERGVISFADKVLNCQAGGGVAAIIYNNEAGALSGTLGGVATTIPSVGVSDTDGAAMLSALGAASSVVVQTGNYSVFDGTSMATPHVSAVAALVWSHHENCDNQAIRNALIATAEDLGDAGRDTSYGYGLVQASDAVNYLSTNGCDGGGGGGGGGGGPQQCELLPKGASCTSDADCCSNSCKGKRDAKTCK